MTGQRLLLQRMHENAEFGGPAYSKPSLIFRRCYLTITSNVSAARHSVAAASRIRCDHIAEKPPDPITA